MATAWSKVVMSSRLTREMVEDAKSLLGLLGIPFVQAPSEGEAQAASMVQRGQAYTVAGKDYDSLLFGSPRLARFVALQSREFLPSIGRYRVSPPEIIDLEENLRALSLSRKQLVEAAILVGTDFDEGVKGIGPKKAVGALKKYGSIESLPGAIRDQLPPNYEAVREYFLDPEADENPAIEKKHVDVDAAIEFLCGERDFSEQRVRKALDRLAKTAPPARTLESFLE